MKNPIRYLNVAVILLIALFISISATSCSPSDKPSEHFVAGGVSYEYAVMLAVPDSMQKQQQQWITETVSAASYHMTGGDYESPEVLVTKTYYRSEELFGFPTEGLKVKNKYYNASFLPLSRLNKEQLQIFKELKYGSTSYSVPK